MIDIDDRSCSLEIMNKDVVVALYHDFRIEPVNKALMPLQLIHSSDLRTWLETRAVDSHRPNSRLVKRACHLKTLEDIPAVMYVNAVTLTDTYWVREVGSKLCWEDVKFKNNPYGLLALQADPNAFSQPGQRTPELTNTGSFEKGWCLDSDGMWWLVKQGNILSNFSEVFVYNLGTLLGFSMAEYRISNGFSQSRNFTIPGKTCFEPAYAIVGDSEDYIETYRRIQKISQVFANQYLEIIFLDAVCFNADRHTFNFGFIRDADTGEFLSLAPNFDNNMTLLSLGYVSGCNHSNIFSQDLNDLDDEFHVFDLYESTSGRKFPSISEPLIRKALAITGVSDTKDHSGSATGVDWDYVVEFILKGCHQIFSLASEKTDRF